jgi:hypothetical protein
MQYIKPLMIIYLGINHKPSDFQMNPSIEDYIRLTYDILYIETNNVFNIKSKLELDISKIEQAEYKERPSIVFLGHSFGCIFSLYIIKKLNIENKTKIIFIDPLTDYMKQFTSKELQDFMNNAPKTIKCKTLIITYYLKGCTDINTCDKSYVIKYNLKKEMMMNLFEDKTNVEVVGIYMDKKIKYIPHDIHKNYPDLVLEHIKSFLYK